jgi:Mn2+/Fe2+ NRAMP family transporter
MEHGKKLNSRTRPLRRRLAVFLAVVGPGLITSNVDNDAGGITTYTVAPAQFGYTMLWSLIPMTIALYVSEEMCARMGVVTGKGLSDSDSRRVRLSLHLLRDARRPRRRFGQHRGGIRGSRRGHGDFWRQQVHFGAAGGIAVWMLVVRGSARQVEKIFLVACGFYLSYVVSAVFAKPDWLLAAKGNRGAHASISTRAMC